MIRELLKARTTVLADVERAARGGERLLVRSDRTGTMQLYELERGGELHQVTALPEPVSAAKYVTRARRAVVQVDTGGNERYQLYVAPLSGGSSKHSYAGLARLTDDGRYVHELAGVAPHEELVAYVSNCRNGIDFDVWLCDLCTGEHKLIYQEGGRCAAASGFSQDGRWLSVLRPGPRPQDIDLLLIDVRSGEVRTILPHPEEAALVGPPAWDRPDIFYLSTNLGTDSTRAVRYDLRDGSTEALAGPLGKWECDVFASPDGSALCVVENQGGTSHARVARPRETTNWTDVPLPGAGVITDAVRVPAPQFSFKGDKLYFSFSGPDIPGDIWAFDIGTATLVRRSESPCDVHREQMVQPEVGEAVSFDGLRVPYFIFRPDRGGEPPPVVVKIHGGPESQAVLNFDPIVQALVNEGFAVVVPNVRGSTGYGKQYASLDDTTRRLGSVRDLGAVHACLADAGLDPGRAALWGASYGGYMVLAGLAFQPELWAAGVDIVGISDLVTFLENTAPYRRAHREREYGSLTADREFLEKASPLRSADNIRAPLFVIHGRNDPRVPVSEAEQLVQRLQARGLRCELTVYEDEGHGIARLENRLDAFPRAIAFLKDVLGIAR